MLHNAYLTIIKVAPIHVQLVITLAIIVQVLDQTYVLDAYLAITKMEYLFAYHVIIDVKLVYLINCVYHAKITNLLLILNVSNAS